MDQVLGKVMDQVLGKVYRQAMNQVNGKVCGELGHRDRQTDRRTARHIGKPIYSNRVIPFHSDRRFAE